MQIMSLLPKLNIKSVSKNKDTSNAAEDGRKPMKCRAEVRKKGEKDNETV